MNNSTHKCLLFFLFFFFYLDDLLADPTSFIYGQRPNAENVPIYAMVTMCNSTLVDIEDDGEFQLISI